MWPSLEDHGGRLLQPIENLIGPEALKAGQRLVDALELLNREADNLFDRMELAVVERIDPLANRLALAASAAP